MPVFYLGASDINFTLMMGQHQDYEIAIDVARQIRNQSRAHFAYSSLQGAGMTWIRDGDGFVNSDHIVRISRMSRDGKKVWVLYLVDGTTAVADAYS